MVRSEQRAVALLLRDLCEGDMTDRIGDLETRLTGALADHVKDVEGDSNAIDKIFERVD
jgi:hypothetical protein